MKRLRITASVPILIALAAPSALLAADDAAQPLVKKPSGEPATRSARPPDPGRIVTKPNPVQTRASTEACTPEQDEMLETARKAAAIRSQIATDHARGLHPTTGDNDKREAQHAADKLIGDDVDFGQITEVTEKMRDRLSSASLKVACQAKSDSNCSMRSAYVSNLEPPIHVCPRYFEDSPEQRIRTLIHESAHLVGIQHKGDGEAYCAIFDCDLNCGGFYAADSWAHFVHCVSGQTPDQADSN